MQLRLICSDYCNSGSRICLRHQTSIRERGREIVSKMSRFLKVNVLIPPTTGKQRFAAATRGEKFHQPETRECSHDSNANISFGIQLALQYLDLLGEGLKFSECESLKRPSKCPRRGLNRTIEDDSRGLFELFGTTMTRVGIVAQEVIVFA